jgi:acetoin utilization deacetylase AcuC-like enzyme
MNKLTIAYSDAYLNWKLGNGDGSHPTNPIRAKLAVEMLEAELPALGVEYEIIEPTFEDEDRNRLLEVHSKHYVSEVLDSGESYEWFGKSQVNADTAALMFGGTVRLVEKMLEPNSEVRVAFNPQGAKHHAHYDYSSGFCVFNDMAWAALEFAKAGKKVIYIDWDAHAGDGVQAILESSKVNVPTFSIHGHGIFPNRADTSVRGKEGNYLFMNEEAGWYNYNLQQGEGDPTFKWAIDDIVNKALDFEPDVIIVATGADGHEGESWGLKYTFDGYAYAASAVADLAERFNSKVLIGGAGGYRPYTATPRIWADVVEVISSNLLSN